MKWGGGGGTDKGRNWNPYPNASSPGGALNPNRLTPLPGSLFDDWIYIFFIIH